jgi:uncharacterized membrane protein YfcA
MVIFTIGAGFLTGFINTLAGSGSAISLAMLNALGMPLDIANGTNRVAIVLQAMVAVYGFHKQKKLDWKGGVWLLVPAMFGSIIGASIAGSLDRNQIRVAIGIAMVVVLVMLFIKPKRWLEGSQLQDRRPGLLQLVSFFFIGMYGGFVQIGVGVFLLVGLVLGAGYDLVKGNAVKVLIVFALTLPALIIFVYHGKVQWGTGFILAIGNMSGAWVATKEAAKRGAVFVRWLLIVVVSISALRYLGILPF